MEQTEVIRQNSVKLSRNAKGDFSWEIKVYSDDTEEVEAKLKETIIKVKDIIENETEESD